MYVSNYIEGQRYIDTGILHVLTHTGRHCCLWCLITQSDLKTPLEKRGRFPVRSVQSLRDDYRRFTESGGNLKHAKLFNNCIGEPLFNISLEKVG